MTNKIKFTRNEACCIIYTLEEYIAHDEPFDSYERLGVLGDAFKTLHDGLREHKGKENDDILNIAEILYAVVNALEGS